VTLERTWNSTWPTTQSGSQVGMFGPNWRSSYEERVFKDSNYLKYSRSDGSFWSFPSSTGAIVAPANAGVTIASGSSYWTITFKNGETRLFSNTSGSMAAVIDRNGNATRMGYDALNRLITVTDAAGRSLQFNYANTLFPNQVTSVTSSVGITTSYNYDNQGRLIQATKPDQTYVTFQYNDQSLITAVLDSAGKILESHTYDASGRGLTSSRANGVEAITMTYPATQ
jgi:YD repeat-containing protein